jgi:peptidyl-dipeptidase A
MNRRAIALLAVLLLSGTAAAAHAATAEEARVFLEKAEADLRDLAIRADQASWLQNTYIVEDSEQLAAYHLERLGVRRVELAKEAARFDGLSLPPDQARKMLLLKTALTLAPPSDPAAAAEVTRLGTAMEGVYGKGKWCPPAGYPKTGEEGEDGCLDINAATRVLKKSRDPKVLLDVWKNWHAVGAPMRKDYERFVKLSNQGASELGFKDAGVLWRSAYDMPPDAFTREVDRLWEQVRPLYVSLHAYVRKRLRETYGPEVVPERGPIPAHLLGNMWAQEWSGIYPIVGPKDAASGYDLTALLKAKKVDVKWMFKHGEGFFTSLGMPALPPTFWERSMLVKPRDREVVCHASAWDVNQVDDVRIKMCTEVDDENFVTIHHELGHNYYYLAYKDQPILFRNGAHDGFHEAVGDTIALSITPPYLVRVGLLDKEPATSSDIGLLLREALDKIGFLPFGLVIDQWRWKVFSGEITPQSYNKAWWELRQKYQGVAPPIPRTEADFDPGAKYHVPANVPYTRYFLARILQFQFHRALCETSGNKLPLNRCSIYENKAAGDRLWKGLTLGASRPWPDALEAMTGKREMDATAMVDYFAPLQKWLDEQNRGVPTGW